MSKKDNFLFWFVMFCILFIGFVIGYLSCNNILRPDRRNKIDTLVFRSYDRDNLQLHVIIRNDTMLRFNYSKRYNP